MADAGYYGVAQTTACLAHTTVSHSFYHDGSWWTFMRVSTAWNLYKEDGSTPTSPGDTVAWVSSAHLSSVHTSLHCSVAVDSANNKAYVIGFDPGAATVVFRVLTYASSAWTVTQSFNLCNSSGVGLGTTSTFRNHSKLSIGVDPNGVPYVVAGNKGTNATYGINGVHIAWPDSAGSLGGTWSFKTIDSDLVTEGDASGRWAGIISQGGTDYIVVGYCADNGTDKHKLAYHQVETTLSNYSSGWTVVDVDATVSCDNHLWAGVMNDGTDQVVVIIGKDAVSRVYLFTSQLGSSLSWTHKRHRVTNGTSDGGTAEDASRGVGVLDETNGEVWVFFHRNATNPEGSIDYKKVLLSDLLASSSETDTFDTSAADLGTVAIWDESANRMVDAKTPAHPVDSSMTYFPVTGQVVGNSIWWAGFEVSAGGGGVSVSVPAAALTLTGYAPTVTNPLSIAIPAASLTLTGYAPTVSTPLTISVPAGSLALTGFAPTIQNPHSIAIPAGALTLSGYAPTVTTAAAGTTVSVPAASLTLTGYAPTVSISAVIAIPPGALTLTGFAPSVNTTLGTIVDVPAGGLTLSGFAPTVYTVGDFTTSVFYLPLRAYADGMSGTVDPTTALDNLRSLLPSQRTPLVNADSTMSSQWYRFFDYMVNQYLGGLTQPTVADIVASVEATQASVNASAEATQLIAQQAQANAESLAAVVQVTQNASIPGASQIPPVSLSYLEP